MYGYAGGTSPGLWQCQGAAEMGPRSTQPMGSWLVLHAQQMQFLGIKIKIKN